jgi:Zn-dependent protease/predicted transcriptional regulator
MFGMRSFKIGRFFGIDIEVHASWIVIFLIVFTNFLFGGGLSPVNPMASPTTVLGWLALTVVALLTTFLFFASVLLHELSHSLVGRRYGVEIKRITLFLFGGLAQMTGEARDAKAEFLMAAAGPASSFVLAVLFGLVGVALSLLRAPALLAEPPLTLAFINALLGIFNLVPGFPLDGGRVFRSIVWGLTDNMETATRIATRVGQVFAVLMISGGAAEALLDPRHAFNGFWLILIGLFLWNAAGSSYQQMEITHALAGVKVGEIMTHGVITAPAGVSLLELVNEYFLTHRFARFPLVEDGKLAGTVTLQDVRQVPQEAWAATPARQVARPVDEGDFVTEATPAIDALMKMAAGNRGQLLVKEDGQVTGIVTRSDVMKAIQLRDALKSRLGEA